MGVAGCLARSDCKERDIPAINQGRVHRRSREILLLSIPLEGTVSNNQVIDSTL